MNRAVVLALLLAGSAAEAQGQGNPINANWENLSVTDPITDARRGIAATHGTAGVLILKCDTPGRGSVYAQIIFPEYMGGRGTGSGLRQLTYRVDSGTPVERSWRYNESYAADFSPDDFLADITNGSKLVVRGIRYDYRSVDITIDIAGAAEAITMVKTSCGDT